MSNGDESGSCEKCGGTGKISYRTPGDLEPTPIGNGVSVQNVGGWSARPCSCVKDLPAIDGEASWWDLENIYSAVVDVPIFRECIEIEADCEVPRNEHGRRLHRTADNAYYPPLVVINSPERVTLHAEDVRKYAEALIAAADACDKADEPVVQTTERSDA